MQPIVVNPRTIFTVVIPNTKSRYYSILANLLIMLGISIFAFYSIINGVLFLKIISACISIIYLTRFYFVLTISKLQFSNIVVGILTATLLLCVKQYIPAMAVLLFTTMEYIVNKPLTIKLNKLGVCVQYIISKQYPWDKLSNVMLSNGLLTIDCTNNKLMQYDVSMLSLSFSEVELNQFVSNCINTS